MRCVRYSYRRIEYRHNFFFFRKHERNPFSLRISWTPPFFIAPNSSILSAELFRYAEQTNRATTKALSSTRLARGRRHRNHPRSARKVNYGRGGELFAGFVALSSLVTFNLLACINLILFYSPRRPRFLRP